ncbi:cyclophilin-like fold protein [Amycolatopsis kentuckyensis]|uniref:cyclophilin-like fold protein n=1 Tax=Amycolatopsis kentuckyensis TaxID=218823 RepID=UPI001FC8F0DA|nr:cyclophilin-like fold protein [Amycolatopsis kentuckyensis]
MILARATLAAALLAVAACSPEAPPSTTLVPTTGSTAAVNIHLTVQGRVVNATLNDSAAARDFASLLPLTLNLSDFHGTERIADLPRRLSTADAPESADPKAGDLAFYAPWGNLAIYYRDAPPASGVVILGHLPDGGAEVLATADQVTVELAR